MSCTRARLTGMAIYVRYRRPGKGTRSATFHHRAALHDIPGDACAELQQILQRQLGVLQDRAEASFLGIAAWKIEQRRGSKVREQLRQRHPGAAISDIEDDRFRAVRTTNDGQVGGR